MKYITFLPDEHQIGGLGHSFCDYLTAVIIAEIFDDVKFIHKDLKVTNQGRCMLINNKNFNWNKFLNLKMLNQVIHINIKNFHKIKPLYGFQSININNLKKMILNNKINYLSTNYRILLFDLYSYELKNLIPKNTTIKLINKLKKNFYLIHKKKEKRKKILNLYLRRGDFENISELKETFREPFLFDSFKFILSLINKDKYEINIISAGTKEQMNLIKKKYNSFNVNFLFNKKQDDIFYLMTQSNILLFFHSSFPFTASLFSDGLIIKKKKDKYFYSACVNKEIKFLDNYIITDNLDSKYIDKINNFL